MRCMYCAEEIQDAAVLCRYCGAVKEGLSWKSPQIAAAKVTKKRPGRWTMLISGAFLLVSAFFEMISVTNTVPLFGGVQDGAIAAIYHVLFTAVFVTMAVPLIWPKPWGLKAVLGGTALYALDRAAYVLDRSARQADLLKGVQGHDEVFKTIPMDTALMFGPATALVSVASFCGLAVFVYFRRDYFKP